MIQSLTNSQDTRIPTPSKDSSIAGTPSKDDVTQQQLLNSPKNHFQNMLDKARDVFHSISNGIGAGYMKTGHNNGPKESVQAIQTLLLEWVKVDGKGAVGNTTIEQVKKELEQGRYGAGTEALVKAFQGSVKLDKRTGALVELDESHRGTGLVADGVLGIRTLNALGQWVARQAKEDPSNAVLAAGAHTLEGNIATTAGDYANQERFNHFVQRTGGRWNVEDGAGDGNDYNFTNNDYRVADSEFSNPDFGKMSPEAMEKVKKLAQQLKIDPDWLIAVISFETGGTFSPGIVNGMGSGATGLIQFMPETARRLGTTTAALSKMSQAEQMDWVSKYFDAYKVSGNEPPKLSSLEDLYMAVLLPSAIGKSNDTVLFQRNGWGYRQNSGLDTDTTDGGVTKAEAAAMVRGELNKIVGSGTSRPGGEDRVQSHGSYTDIARNLAAETSNQEYKLGTWDCSIFCEKVVERKLGRSLTDEERTKLRIDYDLQSQYGGTAKQAYDRALAANDPRLNGAPGFLVEQGLANYCSISELTDQDIAKGAACQISWKDGGGHAGFITGIVRNQDGSIKALRITTAHSIKNPLTGKTGAYEDTVSMAEISKITIAVAK